jgi:NAD(P)-dependent dehydrogenase (short-subunit alcohol dehydrogenase family)
VMITGAARGIGASSARLSHQLGARLVLVDLDEPGLRDLSAEIGGQDVVRIPGDVCDFDAMQRAANTAVERFGAIDVVVANAGWLATGHKRLRPRRGLEETDLR